MGRPIKKRFFVRQGTADASVAVKYEGITASLSAGGTHYSQGAKATVSNPNESDGITATIALTISTTTGVISSIAVTDGGVGYNANPTVTVTTATGQSATGNIVQNSFTITNLSGVNGIYIGMLISEVGGMAANTYVTAVGTNTVTMNNSATNTVTNSTFYFNDMGSGATFTTGLTQVETEAGNGTIAVTAYLSTGTSAVTSAILKQEGSHRYLVENTQGRGVCTLTSGTVTAGTMSITATDYFGSTYAVTKLTMGKARLIRKSLNGTYCFANGAIAKWSTATSVSAANSGTSVFIVTN
jgi:hypothetical protein